jgi:hypothetical protein
MNIPGNKRVLLADLSTIDADVGVVLWVEGVGEYKAVPRDQAASNAVAGPADALTPISWQPSGALVTLSDGSTVAASVVDTMQAGAGGRIAVDSLGQRFPRMSEFNKFISAASQSNINDSGMRAIADGDIYALRGIDRYTDGGTGQVRSRCFNDSTKYLVIGETGDACEQIWWTGNLGVKTAAGATSCVRIPNAYIDPDSAFAVTFLVASMPGNTVADRPLMMIGSQHGTTEQARSYIKQNTNAEIQSYWNGTLAAWSLAGICPYVVTVSAAAGAGGLCSFYRNCAKVTDAAKVAGTIYTEDHTIGGYWDQAGGVWVSYKGFYVLGVIIHNRVLTGAEITGLQRALLDPVTVNGAVTIGQSNNGIASGAVPDAPPLPDYRSAQNEASYMSSPLGWEPVGPVEQAGATVKDHYSVTQGIAQHLPNHVFLKITIGGHTLPAFYDWAGTDYDLLFEPLMRSAWQLGCLVNLKHIFIISGESEADVSTPAATVAASWAECAARYRRGFSDANWYNRNNIRVTTVRLNNQYTLVRPVGTPLVRTGQTNFVAADANARLVDVDAIPLGPDNTHYTANDRIRVGALLGAAAIGA